MPASHFPNGFRNGVHIKNVPILNTHPNAVFWVHSGTGSDGNDGTADRPYATIDYAVGRCAASRGDLIMVKSGHAETLVAASALACDVAGVNIVGLGTGNNRPILTCTPAAVGTKNIDITAANVSISNIIGKAGLDAITNPINISGANCSVDIEWQDGSSTVEAETVILTTAAADNLNINLKYNGFTAGNAVVAPIKLVGATDARINVDFHGVASTSVVNFITTLSTNVRVTGYAFNSGTTDGSKLVVDTIGSSTWYAEIEDGAAGAKFSGGSGGALASDDVSAVNAKLGTITNTGGTATVGAILGDFANSTLYGILAGAAGIPTFPASAAPANAVSIAEVLREQFDQADKAVTNTTAALVNGTTLFTIAGGPIEILSLVARCVTANDGTASTLQWSADPTDGAAVTFSGASASLASVAAGGMVVFQGTTLATAPLVSASGVNIAQAVTNGVVVGAGIITSVVGVGSTTGTWQTHLRYRPLSRGVTVS